MANDLSTFDVEVTDTYGGEANYSWVRRYEIQAPRDCSAAHLVRAAKKAASVSRMRHKPHGAGRYDEQIRLDFYGACICAFITYRES